MQYTLGSVKVKCYSNTEYFFASDKNNELF